MTSANLGTLRNSEWWARYRMLSKALVSSDRIVLSGRIGLLARTLVQVPRSR